jgi:hypothetical protein
MSVLSTGDDFLVRTTRYGSAHCEKSMCVINSGNDVIFRPATRSMKDCRHLTFLSPTEKNSRRIFEAKERISVLLEAADRASLDLNVPAVAAAIVNGPSAGEWGSATDSARRSEGPTAGARNPDPPWTAEAPRDSSAFPAARAAAPNARTVRRRDGLERFRLAKSFTAGR